jgi:hypothetical protein
MTIRKKSASRDRRDRHAAARRNDFLRLAQVVAQLRIGRESRSREASNTPTRFVAMISVTRAVSALRPSFGDARRDRFRRREVNAFDQIAVLVLSAYSKRPRPLPVMSIEPFLNFGIRATSAS